MTARRTDANQQYIIDGLRDFGASVQDLHEVGKGCPDILVGWRGKNYALEIKQPGGWLNEREHKWHQSWRGQVAIVRSLEEAIDVITADDE